MSFLYAVSLPDTDLLILICQVFSIAIVVVKRPHHVCGCPKEVLSASLWGKIGMVAGELGHLHPQNQGYKKIKHLMCIFHIPTLIIHDFVAKDVPTPVDPS